MGQRAEEAAGLPLCHVSVAWSNSQFSGVEAGEHEA